MIGRVISTRVIVAANHCCGGSHQSVSPSGTRLIVNWSRVTPGVSRQ